VTLPYTHNNIVKKIHASLNNVEDSGMKDEFLALSSLLINGINAVDLHEVSDSLAINDDTLKYIHLGKLLDNQVYAMGRVTAHLDFQVGVLLLEPLANQGGDVIRSIIDTNACNVSAILFHCIFANFKRGLHFRLSCVLHATKISPCEENGKVSSR
jgi:hypothetical protein